MGSPSQAYLELGPSVSMTTHAKRILFPNRSDLVTKRAKRDVHRLISNATRKADSSVPNTTHPFKLAEIEKKLSELGIDYRSFQLAHKDLPKGLYGNTSYKILDEIIRRIEVEIHMKKIRESFTETDNE